MASIDDRSSRGGACMPGESDGLGGDPIEAGDIAVAAKLDAETLRRALRAVSTEPFFSKGMETCNGDIQWVGKPTSKALRVSGQWPSQGRSLID
jgi:hypothetical protein